MSKVDEIARLIHDLHPFDAVDGCGWDEAATAFACHPAYRAIARAVIGLIDTTDK